jgi:hypothetical protein
MRVFENRVPSRISGPKRDEVTLGLGKQHKEELPDLSSSRSTFRMLNSKRMIWARHVARVREKRNGYRLLVGKPERKKPLERQIYMWVDNIKMDGCEY